MAATLVSRRDVPRAAKEIMEIIHGILQDRKLDGWVSFWPCYIGDTDTILVDHINNGPNVEIGKVTPKVGCNIQYNGSKLRIWLFCIDNEVEVDLAKPNSLRRLGRIFSKALQK